MKKILIIFSLIFVLVFSTTVINVKADVDRFFTISANPAEDSNTAMNIVWHTEIGVNDSYLVYTKKTDTSWTSSITVMPTVTLNKAFSGLNAKYGTTKDEDKIPYEFNKNEVSLTNLDPGTEYMYKVTDGVYSSDVRYFKTGDKEFNFVWVSDFHAYYANASRLNKASVAVNKCIDEAGGDVDFILSTGDIVAHGGTYEWWKQVGTASWMKKYMFATTLGNHDWMTNVGTYYSNGASYAFMDACYNNPRNGFEGQENICYYFHYGDALFICVNTELESAKYLGLTSQEFIKAQQDWVEDVLLHNKAQYIFLFQHYQAFSTTGAYHSAGYSRWHDICDRFGVDIFLSGNSHVYMRSLPIYNGSVSTDETKGTVYMVAPSSDGERGETYNAPTTNTDKIVASYSDPKSQAASILKVREDGISLKLVSYDGTIIDEATILPKREPTSSIQTDLSSFDKDAFESSFKLTTNQKDISEPTVSFAVDAYSVLNSLKICDKDSDKIYYNGVLYKDCTELKLKLVEKGIRNIIIELNYIDSSTSILEFEFDNSYNWGSISNVNIRQDNLDLYFEWDEEIDQKIVDSKIIYIDGVVYKRLNLDVHSVILPQKVGNHTVSLVVKDFDGDVVYTSGIFDYIVDAYYTVTFVNEAGAELKKETVKEGSPATPPEYNAPDGYKFTGWDTDYNNVNSDLTIKVILEKKEEETPPEVVEPTTPTLVNNKKTCKKKQAFIFVLLICSSCYLLMFKRKQ